MHPLKAFAPISVTLSGITTLFRRPQLVKQETGILDIPFPIDMDLNSEHVAN